MSKQIYDYVTTLVRSSNTRTEMYPDVTPNIIHPSAIPSVFDLLDSTQPIEINIEIAENNKVTIYGHLLFLEIDS